MSAIIFISHRSTDKEIADILLGFLVGTGIPREVIFCSSLPGNDVIEKISGEVKSAIKNSLVNVAILSRDYYQSAYCLNEAGVMWYLDNTPIIPIALPEVNPENMIGFLNSDYKLRRLDNDSDIACIYDTICEAISAPQSKMGIVTYETKKLKEQYRRFLENRKEENLMTSVLDLESVITTDDERVVLYYIVTNKCRRVSKAAVYDWLCENEIHDINLENALDLLSTFCGGTLSNDMLELSIEVFRKYSTESEALITELKPYVDRHVRLSSERFQELWQKDALDDYIKLFVNYIIEERVHSFGDRWMAKSQIESIEQWEAKNSMYSNLSENYGSCLEFFIQNGLVYESGWTSYGNPREYTLGISLQKHLLCCREQYLKSLSETKDSYSCKIPF